MMPNTKFEKGELTKKVYQQLFFGNIDYLEKDIEGVIADIIHFFEFDTQNVFLDGVTEYLKKAAPDTDFTDEKAILVEIKRRYKHSVVDCPKQLENWLRDTAPSTNNRQINYDFCFAMGMDINETTEFFAKHFYATPFNYKDTTDAIFFYCINNNRPHDIVKRMLEAAKSFVPNDNSDTQTVEIGRYISEIDDDEEFLRYLGAHCYNRAQQHTKARQQISELVIEGRKKAYNTDEDAAGYKNVPTDSNAGLIKAIFNTDTQNKPCEQTQLYRSLPAAFTKSLPTQNTISRILDGKDETDETLRKTLILLSFFCSYADTHNKKPCYDKKIITAKRNDFTDETNSRLSDCGLAPLYLRNPFDCVIEYCAAMSYDPLALFHQINYERFYDD